MIVRKFIPVISFPNVMKKPVVWQKRERVDTGLFPKTTTEKMKYQSPLMKQPSILNIISLPRLVRSSSVREQQDILTYVLTSSPSDKTNKT
jgi:hypothetical protein